MIITPTIFKEYDIRGKYPEEISDNAAYALGLAFAKVIKAKKIAIGRDARKESEKAFWPLVAGLSKGGIKIYDLGVCATPELFFAVGTKKFPGGVMVTASHSPTGETGFKFCDSKGRVFGLNSGSKILEKFANQEINKIPSGIKFTTKSEQVDFISIALDYKKFALSFIKPSDIKDFNIILDASGGSGGRLAEVIFDALPLKFTAINFRASDKKFGHGPNPLLKENRAVIISQVKAKKADLGVIFDGDADRAIFIDEQGRFVEPYHINCLMSQIILAMKKGATIVADARLNLAIEKAIRDSGGKILVHRAGYANFIKTMTEKKLLFGCENSGHFMYNFNLKNKKQFVYGDAIISVLLVLKYLKQNKLKLSEAIKPISSNYQISGELNFKTARFDQISQEIKKLFPRDKISLIDGLSVTAVDRLWFFNIRPSHTEPVIRLNIEAVSKETLEKIKKQILELI
ncbi:MAG: hypothetical protein WCT26_00195 [Candidatus Buchananbacteria bacterium]|jgi:phosphomannomutase